jgi:hypothetical protein
VLIAMTIRKDTRANDMGKKRHPVVAFML